MNATKPYSRTERVGKQILEILGEISTKYIDTTHLGLITFTQVLLSPDLRYAKVFFSVVGKTLPLDAIVIELNHLRKNYRRYLGHELKIRNTPELSFHYDETIEEANRINALFAKINHPSDDAG